ncbi:MAG: formylglycine-generating enzyme family protein [Gemmataceae bacterium]
MVAKIRLLGILCCFLTASRSLISQEKIRFETGNAQNTAGKISKTIDGPQPGEERTFEIERGKKMIFCWVPKGECQLGSPKAEREEALKVLGDDEYWLQKMDEESDANRGKYRTNGFWLGKYTVTQNEWRSVMGTTPFAFCKNGDYADEVKGIDTSRYPAESLTWNDCQAFLKKINHRKDVEKIFGQEGAFVLPNEDEWEYACRGGNGNKQTFYWGNVFDGEKANCGGSFPDGTKVKVPYQRRPIPVGSYEKIAKHPWNLCDMHGNVWQWCENWYDDDDDFRVLRGGSWGQFAVNCRSSYRYRLAPDDRNSSTGFRICFRLSR